MARKYEESGGNWFKTALQTQRYAFPSGVGGALSVNDGGGRWPGTDSIRVHESNGSAECGPVAIPMDSTISNEFYFGMGLKTGPGYVGQMMTFVQGGLLGSFLSVDASGHLYGSYGAASNNNIATFGIDSRAVITSGVFNSIVLGIKPSTASSGADGFFKIWLNDQLVYSKTAIRTAYNATYVDSFRFTTFGTGTYIDVCDLWMNDTTTAVNNGWQKDQRLYVCRPSGAGQYAQLTADPAGANWENVAETNPDEGATRVIAVTAPLTDAYQITKPPSNLLVCNNVSTILLATKDDAGDCQAAAVLGDGVSAVQESSPFFIAAGQYMPYRASWPLNPWTSAAWQPDDFLTSVNGNDPLQAGVKRTA